MYIHIHTIKCNQLNQTLELLALLLHSLPSLTVSEFRETLPTSKKICETKLCVQNEKLNVLNEMCVRRVVNYSNCEPVIVTAFVEIYEKLKSVLSATCFEAPLLHHRFVHSLKEEKKKQ